MGQEDGRSSETVAESARVDDLATPDESHIATEYGLG